MVKPFLSENAMEVKIVNIMMQSAYLCVILYFKHKKKFPAVFTRPLSVTSQASSSTTTYKIYLILLRRSKAFHSRQNPFEILQHIKKTLLRGSINLPPLPCTTGVEFARAPGG